MRRLSTALILLALLPAGAGAQTAAGPIVRMDVSASIGWFSADRPATDDGRSACCEWSSGLFRGFQGGYYWSDHIKTELEIAATGQTETSSYFPSPVGSSAYRIDDHYYRDVLVSAGQFYQAGRNSFFHPFVGAGIDVDREHHEIEQIVRTGAKTDITTVTETRLRARPFVAGGFKAYFSERVFFRTDVKMGYRSRLDQIAWRLGVGIDF